jgi:D-amino peptidase
MTAEVNAAIDGALAGGATAVVVNDAHGSMRNILLEELNPAAQLVTGWPKPLSMMQGIDEGFEVAFFIGYHAQAGSTYGTLNHTWSGRVHTVALNGQPVGELGLNAALAGHFGIPVALVTGDQTLVEEARAMLGDIEAVAVKQAYGMRAARCLAPSKARSLIKKAAARAVQKHVAPFVVPPPITLAISFQQTIHADMAELVPGSQRLNSRTVEFAHEDMPRAYRAWRAMVGLASLAR